MKQLGQASSTGSNRVNRGGSWNNNARNCRSANRNNNTPDNRNNNLGFRLASTQKLRDSVHSWIDRECLFVSRCLSCSGNARTNSAKTAAAGSLTSRSKVAAVFCGKWSDKYVQILKKG